MTAAFLAAWWMQSLMIAALLAATAAVLQWIARDAVPARALWGAALVGATLLTFLAPFRLRETTTLTLSTVPGRPLSATEVANAARFDIADAAQRLAATVGRALETPPAIVAGWARALPESAVSLALGAWFLVSIGLLALLFGSHRRLRRSLSHIPAEVIDGVVVRVTSALGPAVVGVREPVVVVPQWLLALSAREQALVVRHERSHVAARDPLLLMAGVALAAIQPWNPFTWLVVSRLRLAIELDCDRRLLRDGTPPRAYGDLLIALAGEASPALRPAVLHPMFSHHTSHLAQRILAMTERPVRRIITRRVAVVALAAVATIAACESRLPTDAEVETMDAAMVERRVEGVLAVDESAKRYLIDGRLATEVETNALLPADISSVEVVKGVVSEIRVTTRDGVLARAAGVTVKPPVVVERRVEGVPLRSRLDGGGPISADTFTGILILDGVRIDAARLKQIPPDRVESVEVMKGAAAKERFGADAANGAIVIRLKPIR